MTDPHLISDGSRTAAALVLAALERNGDALITIPASLNDDEKNDLIISLASWCVGHLAEIHGGREEAAQRLRWAITQYAGSPGPDGANP